MLCVRFPRNQFNIKITNNLPVNVGARIKSLCQTVAEYILTCCLEMLIEPQNPELYFMILLTKLLL